MELAPCLASLQRASRADAAHPACNQAAAAGQPASPAGSQAACRRAAARALPARTPDGQHEASARRVGCQEVGQYMGGLALVPHIQQVAVRQARRLRGCGVCVVCGRRPCMQGRQQAAQACACVNRQHRAVKACRASRTQQNQLARCGSGLLNNTSGMQQLLLASLRQGAGACATPWACLPPGPPHLLRRLAVQVVQEAEVELVARLAPRCCAQQQPAVAAKAELHDAGTAGGQGG